MKKAQIVKFGEIRQDQEGELILSGFIYKSNDQENEDQNIVLLQAAIDWLKVERENIKARQE
jgi:hypothetical protein